MWLILCSSSDPSGLWVYEGLRQFGIAQVELVLAEWLAYGSRWEHRLDGSGTYLKMILPDGRVLCSSRIRGVINRLLVPAPGIAERAAASDKQYAQAELQAFYLSWMKGLPGTVINRPTPIGLCGPCYHPSEWACRASRAGLPTPPYRQSGHDAPEKCYHSLVPEGATTSNVIAFRGEVFGATLPEAVVRACTKLGRDSETEMLGIGLYAARNGEWTFANATPCPDLSVGGNPLLRRLATALTQGEPA
jgi:hypothetical protein